MNIIKRSEKLIVWMHRTGKTQLELSKDMNINRQALAKKIDNNNFEAIDLVNLKRIGFTE